MDIETFESLDVNKKANATWNGVFIDERSESKYKYLLYSIGNFFVEVRYDTKINKIIGFRSFKTQSLLDIYLKGIKIGT